MGPVQLLPIKMPEVVRLTMVRVVQAGKPELMGMVIVDKVVAEVLVVLGHHITVELPALPAAVVAAADRLPAMLTLVVVAAAVVVTETQVLAVVLMCLGVLTVTE